MNDPQRVRPKQCSSCPFGDHSPFPIELTTYLAQRSLMEARLWHHERLAEDGSLNDNPYSWIYRESRDIQLRLMTPLFIDMGLLSPGETPNDETWAIAWENYQSIPKGDRSPF